MKIAVAQIACELGDLPANLRKIRNFAERAKEASAELVVFPEMSDTGYAMRGHPGAGGAMERRSGSRIAKHRANSFDRDHQRGVGTSRRSHLQLAGRDRFEWGDRGEISQDSSLSRRSKRTNSALPGDALASVDFGPLHVGLTICYDLRFPEIYRALAIDQGVNVFVISSAWPFPRVEHLRVLATARAIENQSYVILANRVGRDDGGRFCGTSAVIDPAGVVVAAASSEREELVLAEVSAETIQSVRDAMPVFANRREDLYRQTQAGR